MSLRFRQVWLRAHLYVGLTVGLLFALLGLTGSFLVFHHTIDEWLNPGVLLATDPAAPHRPLAAIDAAARAATPDQVPAYRMIQPPRHPGGAYVVSQSEPAGHEFRLTGIHVDPSTARVLGRRVRGEYLVSWVYVLHSHLHLGHNGEATVGFAGVFLTISALTGLVLWWPIVRRGGSAPPPGSSGRT